MLLREFFYTKTEPRHFIFRVTRCSIELENYFPIFECVVLWPFAMRVLNKCHPEQFIERSRLFDVRTSQYEKV